MKAPGKPPPAPGETPRETEQRVEAIERRRAQAALAQSEAGLHRAQLMAKLAHVVTGPDGSFETWSETLPQLIGVDPSQLPRTTRAWMDMVHPDDRAVFRTQAIEAGVKKLRVGLEYRFRRADGRWIHVRQTMEPLKVEGDAAGRSQWFNTLQDVTAERQTEESLRDSELRFRQMAENISDVFFLVDAGTYRTLYVSPAYEEISGRSCESLLGKLWTEAIHQDDQASTYAQNKKGMATGKFEYEYRIVRPDGSIRWIESRAFPVRDDGGKIVRIAGVGKDITERKEADSRIRRLNRVYAVLSGINTLIVRVKDRDELFDAACRIAVEAGMFRMCWLGLADRDAMKIVPVASAGSTPEHMTFIKDQISLAMDTPAGDNLVARAIAEKKICFCNDTQNDPGYRFRKEHAEKGTRSVAVLPLLVADEAIGVLALYTGEAGFFDADELKLLTELAGDISFALDHIEKAGKLERVNRVNAMLSSINGAIVRIRDRQELFRESCRIAVEAGELRLAWIGMVDTQTELIVPAAFSGPGEGFLQVIRLSTRQDSEQFGMAGRAIRDRAPAVSNDVLADERARFRAQSAQHGFRSLAMIPLVVHGTAVGILGLHAAEAGFFNQDEMNLLMEIAGNLAFALEHIEQEEKLGSLSRVYAVSSGINALIVRAGDRDELFEEACRIVVDAGRFRMCWMGLVDRNAMKIVPVASAGAEPEFLTLIKDRFSLREGSPLGNTMSARAVREKKAIVSNEIRADAKVLFAKERIERGIFSMAILPLLVSGDAVGVLALYADTDGFFDEQEMKLLTELAGDIAFAIDHIDKAGKLERVNRVNAMLSNINGAIVRIRDRQALFEEACRIAVEIGGLPFAWLGMVDEAEMRVRPVASAGTAEEGFLEKMQGRLSLRDEAPEGNGITARSLRERCPLVVSDIEAHPDLGYKKAYADRGIKSMVALPMFVAGRAVGAFTLHAAEVGFFDDEEMKLLCDVAGNIAFALELIEKEEKVQRLTRVYAVLSGINTLIVRVKDRDELFREACRIAVEHGRFKMAWIGVVNRSAMKIEPVASSGSKPEYMAFIKDQFSLVEESPMGNTMTARAIREKMAFFSNDSQNDPRIKFKKEHVESATRSLAILPLLVSDQAVGTLSLYAEEADFFDAEEVKLLTELAGDIAFAIDHIDKRERLNYLAYYDALTGLANRSLFLERVGQYIRSAASGGHKLALCLIDLERFKNINDSLGRATGDALLRQVAEWLARNLGGANLLARVDADHFAVVVPEVKKEGDLARLFAKTSQAFLDHPFHLNDAVFRVAAKAGIALFPDDGADADALFRNAEAALKKAKAGGDRYLFYTQKMTEMVAVKLTLENQLRQALDKQEFVLHYQPKGNFRSGELTGAEALIRWNDPRTGLVPPGRFIPILEETGLIYEVGRWGLRRAIEDYLRWRDAGLPAVRIAVNVSPLQLRNPGFIAEIRQVIGIDAHAADGLELEITESLIMEDVKNSIATLHAIRAMGVTIAIDDFGTGFSSLSYLAKLPVDTLKIDRSFVIDMTTSPEGLALVSTIITLAHALNLKVVAEGVETEEQSRLLRLLNCDEMQGFLFSKPVPGEIFEAKFLVRPPG